MNNNGFPNQDSAIGFSLGLRSLGAANLLTCRNVTSQGSQDEPCQKHAQHMPRCQDAQMPRCQRKLVYVQQISSQTAKICCNNTQSFP
jgi:hypothetical protein